MSPSLDLTVAAVTQRDGKFLVVEERAHGEVVINQPAGHVESGEDLVHAVVRETLEETAWDFVPEAIVGIYMWQHPVKSLSFLRISFCGEVTQHYPERDLDDGIIRALWQSRNELSLRSTQLRSPMVLRSIDDYLAGHRLPYDTIRELPLNALIDHANEV